jgi:hypothetical protein
MHFHSKADEFVYVLQGDFIEDGSMNHYRYQESDPIDPRFQAIASVEGRELMFDIRTELETGERSTVLPGSVINSPCRDIQKLRFDL